MADLLAGTIKVDWGDLKRALKALGWEGASVYYAIPVRGGIEIGTKHGVEVYALETDPVIEPEAESEAEVIVVEKPPVKKKPSVKRKSRAKKKPAAALTETEPEIVSKP